MTELELIESCIAPIRDEITTAFVNDPQHWFEKHGFPMCVTAWNYVLRSRGFDKADAVALVETSLNLR